MPYVHLANGEHRKMTTKEFTKAIEESGSQHALHDNGVEHHIVGVYPEEVEYTINEDQQKENTDREEFEQWKRDRAQEDNVA